MLRTTAAQNAIFVLLGIFLSLDEVCGLAPIERHLLTEVLAHLVWGQLADALIADAIGFAGSPKGVQKKAPRTRGRGHPNGDFLEVATWWYSSLSLCGSLPTCRCFCGASSRDEPGLQTPAHREWDCPQRRRLLAVRCPLRDRSAPVPAKFHRLTAR
jgi:hypothetical protein